MKKLFFFFIFFFSFSSLFSQQEVNQLDKNKKIINTDFPGFIKLNLGLNFLLENNEAMKMKAITSRSVGLNYSKPLFLSIKGFNTGMPGMTVFETALGEAAKSVRNVQIGESRSLP